MSENRSNSTIIGIVSIITIISTVLTQVPAITGYFRPVMYVMWIIALFVGLVNNKAKIPLIPFFIVFVVVVLILWAEYFANLSTHENSYIIQVVSLPLICYVVGLLFARRIDTRMSTACLITLFITSFAMFSYIFFNYIGNFRIWLNANHYIYEQKNSAAQIIGCTIIISAFLIKPSHKLLKAIKNIALIFLFLIIVAMQCRSALISIILTAAVFYVSVLRGKKRLLVSALCIIAIVLVLNSDVMLKYVYKAFVSTDRQSRSLDSFTSGRLTYFKQAWELFVEHPVVGTGHHRVDNLYLCVLSDVGLIGFIPIMILWVSRITSNVLAFIKNKTPFTACVLCLTVFYFGESFAEAYPPFGPGVCAFMFWVICAFVDVRNFYSIDKSSCSISRFKEQ